MTKKKEEEEGLLDMFATWENPSFTEFPCVLMLTDPRHAEPGEADLGSVYACEGLSTLAKVLPQVLFDYFEEGDFSPLDPTWIGRLSGKHGVYDLNAIMVLHEETCTSCLQPIPDQLSVEVLGVGGLVATVKFQIPRKVGT